jgi:hypothetical protein
MHGNLEPEEKVMSETSHWLGHLGVALQELDWGQHDEIVVDIGGTQVSGIDVGENYNPKWSSPLGTRKYNKDAFIVIKNLSRSPFEPSKPNPDLKAHHAES